jgi:ATP-dependent Clp protease ATP-binding subunit ClpC
MLSARDPLDSDVLDARIRSALGLLPSSEIPIQVLDLLAAVVATDDTSIRDLLAPALRSDDLGQLRATLPPVSREGQSARSRDEFSPAALKVLDEFTSAFRRVPSGFGPVGLELLLYFVLVNLSDFERSLLSDLRLDLAIRNVRSRVAGPRLPSRACGTGRSGSRDGHPFALPPQIAPASDLTWAARNGDDKWEFPLGDEPSFAIAFEGLARALHRRFHPNAVVVGERGVGGGSLVREFARRAAVGQIPFLAERVFLWVDCRHVPADESRPRLAALLAHTASRPDLVLCLDGFASILRTDRGEANKAVLMEALSSGRCNLIGLLTPREYEELAGDDPELSELFCRVDVREPSPDAALRLVGRFASDLSQRTGIAIEPEAVRQAVSLTANYVLHDHLPAKAVRVLARASEDLHYDRSQLRRERATVTGEDVVRIVSEISGVPVETLRGVADESDYESGLNESVFGQDHAVREVATEIGLIKAGMADPTKPASVMLFLGQTGTGKTEMAKAIARLYSASKRVRTYTMGNCVEPHSVATIIGVPPGYVGHDRGGRLVNELNADPHCVVLLDEVDKAHPDVLQPFLNLFDEGWVTDQRGARAYGTKAIFVLTTNVGQRMIADMHREGKSSEEIAARMKEALGQIRHSKADRPVFTPEFLARIKRVIVFRPLDASAMRSIVTKQTADLVRGWTQIRGKQLVIPPGLSDYVGAAAHRLDVRAGGKEGGRIVRKLMADWVEAPLQREISRRPNDYQRSEVVSLDMADRPGPPDDEPYPAPEVVVRFGER